MKNNRLITPLHRIAMHAPKQVEALFSNTDDELPPGAEPSAIDDEPAAAIHAGTCD